jgi:hypothetical protein
MAHHRSQDLPLPSIWPNGTRFSIALDSTIEV